MQYVILWFLHSQVKPSEPSCVDLSLDKIYQVGNLAPRFVKLYPSSEPGCLECPTSILIYKFYFFIVLILNFSGKSVYKPYAGDKVESSWNTNLRTSFVKFWLKSMKWHWTKFSEINASHLQNILSLDYFSVSLSTHSDHFLTFRHSRKIAKKRNNLLRTCKYK